MSYRLIDSNSIELSCSDANSMPCIYVDLPNGLDGEYYDLRLIKKTNYDKYFSSPEKLAGFIVESCKRDGYCSSCILRSLEHVPQGFSCGEGSFSQILNWLTQEIES